MSAGITNLGLIQYSFMSGGFPHPVSFHKYGLSFLAVTQGTGLELFSMDTVVYWKNRNAKVFKNQIRSPFDILRTAEIEGVLWAEAQKDASINRGPLDVVGKALPHGIDKCYIDGT